MQPSAGPGRRWIAQELGVPFRVSPLEASQKFFERVIASRYSTAFSPETRVPLNTGVPPRISGSMVGQIARVDVITLNGLAWGQTNCGRSSPWQAAESALER